MSIFYNLLINMNTDIFLLLFICLYVIIYIMKLTDEERNRFKSDFKWSSEVFYEYIWQFIKPHLNGEIVKLENVVYSSDVEKTLDALAGIDCWHVTDGYIVRGIASRIQITQYPYNSFTIRLSRDNGNMTEYEKRKFAITNANDGCVYPHFTIQSYIASKSGPLLSCGIAKTRDVIKFIDNELHYTRRTSNATFAVCEWDRMIEYGYDVLIIIP